jgi:hypothetical protein
MLPLMKELRQTADLGNGAGARWAAMRVQRLMSVMMTDLSYSQRLHGKDLGRRSTVDIDAPLAEC